MKYKTFKNITKGIQNNSLLKQILQEGQKRNAKNKMLKSNHTE